MKRQIFPVLILSLVLPCVVSRVFQMEGQKEPLHENRTRFFMEPSSGGNRESAGELIGYAGLSTKQINYLIP